MSWKKTLLFNEFDIPTMSPRRVTLFQYILPDIDSLLREQFCAKPGSPFRSKSTRSSVPLDFIRESRIPAVSQVDPTSYHQKSVRTEVAPLCRECREKTHTQKRNKTKRRTFSTSTKPPASVFIVPSIAWSQPQNSHESFSGLFFRCDESFIFVQPQADCCYVYQKHYYVIGMAIPSFPGVPATKYIPSCASSCGKSHIQFMYTLAPRGNSVGLQRCEGCNVL